MNSWSTNKEIFTILRLRILAIVILSGYNFSLCYGKLEWEFQKISYDATWDDKKIIAVFPFTNLSGDKIEIINVSSSCGCTVVRNPKVFYEPGEKDEISATFTFGDRVGLQTKIIEVMYSNQYNTFLDHLTINANIPEKIRITPRLLRWKLKNPVTQKQAEVFVSPSLGYSLRGVSSIRDEVKTSIEAIDSLGNFIIKIYPGKLSSAKRFMVNVEFLNPQSEVISFPILCVVR